MECKSREIPMETDFMIRLREIRESKGLSQGELAKMAGLKPASISHFETGQRSPSFANLRKLADALSTTIDFLMGRDEIQRPAGNVADVLLRSFSKLNPNDQKWVASMVEGFAERNASDSNIIQDKTTESK